MTDGTEKDSEAKLNFAEAARFWEPRRLWYTGVLFVFVVLWVALTWPHFRPAMNWLDLGRMTVLALLANVCYSAAYLVEAFMQALVAPVYWRRIRWAVWVAGMLLASLIANYWIADEIFPDVQQGSNAVLGANVTGSATMASNMNFPAPLAVLGFLAAGLGLVVALAAVMIFWFARKPKFARMAAMAIGAGGVVYLGLLMGFSAGSRSTLLARGQEKYFCEIDCHLAYSIVNVDSHPDASGSDCVVTLRTRFDETTTSPQRPKDATLTPSRREVRLVDAAGREYLPISTSGTALMTPLKPAETYTTWLEFRIPQDAGGLRLLINTVPAWPDRLVIGDENSWLHKKTYLAL